jgi:hypothetical protein
LRKIKLLILASFISNRELKREAAWSRIHLVPLILAEQDRDAYRRNEAALAREKEIMKDVPDWEVSRTEGLNRLIWLGNWMYIFIGALQVGKKVYNTARYTAPNIYVLWSSRLSFSIHEIPAPDQVAIRALIKIE